MDSTNYATAIALRELQCTALQSHDDRMLLQYKVYLAQDFGLPLGYGFGWYIHGPYSHILSGMACCILQNGFCAVRGLRFAPKYQGIVSCVNNLESEAKFRAIRLKPAEWYGLIAAVAYWVQQGITTKKDMVDTLHRHKPQFVEEEVSAACKAYEAAKLWCQKFVEPTALMEGQP